LPTSPSDDLYDVTAEQRPFAQSTADGPCVLVSELDPHPAATAASSDAAASRATVRGVMCMP
jgi:hypothetical protein